MISLILPTYKEAANLPELITEIREALTGLPHEIIVVDDDSPDRTWEVAERLGESLKTKDERQSSIRSIRRVGERGLSSAVIRGFHEAKGEFLVVMDADGQHDPRLIPRMIDALKVGATMAVGSRYIEGGSVEGWIEARHFASKVATAFARLVTQVKIQDPMSGFFAIQKETFTQIAPKLRPSGFKILLEMLSWLPKGSTIFEVPLIFRKRRKGESKLSWKVELQYFTQVLRLFFLGRGGKQWILFALICLAITALLAPRAWDLRLLYLDSEVRTETQFQVKRLADQNGWLLSDIELREVHDDHMMFIVRNHIRGEDPSTCYTLVFGTSDPEPCPE